ncbi:MAG: hypothetical protein JWP44_829 [Mucilaginibacter sp.]|nr:hypothetical protein [Mucilaginibacter sp.]
MIGGPRSTFMAKKGMKETIEAIPYLNNKDMNFVSKVFNIPLLKMKCYIKKQSQPAHWNS